MPRQVDHELRREEVGEAALRVIARDGVAGASIRAIAGEAGMSTSWITHYFDDHDDVLAQAVDQLRRFFEKCCGGFCELPPGKAVRAMLLASSRGPEQAIAGQALLHLSAGPIPEATRHEIAQFERWCTSQLEEQLIRAAKDGYEGPADFRAAASDLRVFASGLRLAAGSDPDDWPIERIEDSIDRALANVLGERQP